MMAGRAAWGHTFPPVRTVVIQVEPCSVALLVGYRPGSGESTETILSRVASQPKSHGLEALRDLLALYAMTPLSITADGAPLVPTSVRAKIGVEPTSGRPMIVLLVTFPLRAAARFAIQSADPRTTRISWQDPQSHRVPIADAPAQGRWYTGMASFLLSVEAGGFACASLDSSSSLPSSHSLGATSPTIRKPRS